MTAPYRRLPSVDRLLAYPEVRELAATYAHEPVVDLVRHHLEEARRAIRDGAAPRSPEGIVADILREAQRLWRSSPRQVINATGVVLHTNLGRAPLSQEALEAMLQAARSYSDLELDLAQGKRGSRQAHVEALLRQLTGAEAALVVNNNAAALLLSLAALASGREVIVSRGEAVEIGGGFRIPDVLRQSGATLVEVGTTNRTYLEDYENAVTEKTAALLTVHASNFRITGFTHAPAVAELVELGARHGIPVLHDLGSGCLLDTTAFGLAHEPMPQESIAGGASLAFFSGDKMLGGPQAGIVVGKSDAIARLKRHPLARAVRIDKLSLAALTATLLHYLKGEATDKIPIWRMVSATPEALKDRASHWQIALGGVAQVLEGESTVGGGSLPGETMPTWLLSPEATVAGGPEALARRLREQEPPVVARIEGDRVVLDPRTVLPEEEGDLLKALNGALA